MLAVQPTPGVPPPPSLPLFPAVTDGHQHMRHELRGRASAQSHAILAGWGMSDLYLALADHDEYLALPSQGSIRSVQSLVKYCFGRRSAVRPLRGLCEVLSEN